MADSATPKHRTMYHTQFSRPFNTDTSSLPQNLKSLVLNAPRKPYTPEIVAIRDDQHVIVQEKDGFNRSRREGKGRVQFKEGFCADPKEPYKCLGEPVLESERLLGEGLGVAFERRENKEDNSNVVAAEDEVGTAVRRLKISGSAPHPSNGFHLIKHKLNESRHRIHSVKFGLPLLSTLPHRPRQAPTKQNVQEGKVDWTNLRVDTDKMAYFLNVLGREGGDIRDYMERQRMARERGHGPEPHGRANSARWENPRAAVRNVTRPATVNQRKRSRSLESTTSSTVSHAAPATLSPKAIEQLLGIHREDRTETLTITDSYFTTRSHFLAHLSTSTTLLSEILARKDSLLPSHLGTLAHSFHVSPNTLFDDSIKRMRQQTHKLERNEREHRLKHHPWWSELAKLSQAKARSEKETTERNLLSRIKAMIEAGETFTPATFVQLMKVIPQHEFMRDEVQRVLRFVKQHESISEREYLEAVEMSGQTVA
ncbi:hypothetical protein BC832DRAFT_615443 [Gaertneriomyces semiglobifer]|nr:hypothetical protein BC832DRAFT_615443 [Gaertneriomyces semiglobifer]